MWFRRVRIVFWLLVLAVVSAGLYLNQVGLPDFLKRPLLDQLRQRGVELAFGRLRLRWYAGVVAENVRIGPSQSNDSPKLTAGQADLDLDWAALLRGQVRVTGLNLWNGRFEYPLFEPNAPPRKLVVEEIQARLRFPPDDEWALEDFRARFAAAKVSLAGTITNASALGDWQFFVPSPKGESNQPVTAPRMHGTARERLRVFAEAIERMSFKTAPELRLLLTGDARDPQTFALRLTFLAPDADTPWGRVAGALVNARVFPAAAGTPSRAEVTLEGAEARTPWAELGPFGLELKLGVATAQTNCVAGDIALHAVTIQTRWATATNVQGRAQWIHSLASAIPISGHGELFAASPSTKWARSGTARLAVSLATATNPPVPDASWGWWTNLLPYHLSWEADVTGLESGPYAAGRIRCAGNWLAPAVTITNLEVGLPRSHLKARTQMDVASRATSFEATLRPDLDELATWLPADAMPWLTRCRWAEPPHLQVSGAVILPAWTNRAPDWRNEVWPTFQLSGDVAVTNSAYLGVDVDWARSHVTCTNQVWQLPGLEVHRPDGQVRADPSVDEHTKDFRARVQSTLNPQVLRPLFGTKEQRGFDLFTFTEPPLIDAEVWGRLGDARRFGVRGSVGITNFTFRDTPVTAFVSGLAYSNQLLKAFEPRIWRGTQHLGGAGVAVDFAAQLVHFTNVFSTDDPMVVTRAIGPKTARAIEPYHFDQPPTVHLEGTVPMHGNAGADLRVEVSGGPFHWWKFNASHATASVHWREDLVTLTNVNLAFYEGQAQGWFRFDSGPEQGTACQFAVEATNMNFHELMADLTTPTNRLEGTLNAALTVTEANTADWRSWNGYGNVSLRDGWIWAIPIFGVLSGPLDGIVPGLGSSRVTSGSARYVITNGVVFSDDLEWRAAAMRLKYFGGVDLEGHVNATVQAELLRDTWLVGRIVSLALWPVSKMLEFKVTGTLSKPKAEPLYIPRMLTAPLRTLKQLFPSEAAPSKPPSEDSTP